MLSIFSGINPFAKKFDLQHGTIHANKESYLMNGIVSKNIVENNAYLLVSGEAFKTLLLRNEKGNYFISHVYSIGSSIYPNNLLQLI